MTSTSNTPAPTGKTGIPTHGRLANPRGYTPISERSDCVGDCLARVMTLYGFFGSYFYSEMKLVETLDVKTAATDGITMWINPEWFKPLTLDERVFVFCHEVLHAVMLHFQRGKFWHEMGTGPDGKPYSHQTSNKAADYIINSILKESHVGTMPKRGLWSSDIDGTWSLEDAYKKVAVDEPEGGDGDGESEGGHGGFDDHLEPEGEPADEEAVKVSVQAALATAKIMGDVPAALERALAKLMESKVTWEEELRRSLEPTTGRDDVSWRRPSRRKLVLHDLYLPSSCGYKTGSVAVQIDTSGSVSEDEMSQFLGELSHIMSHCEPDWIKVIWVDADVYEEDIESAEELAFIKPKGGGGTDMGLGLDFVREMEIKPETLVVLTDGYTPWGSPIDGVDIIWGVTDKNITAGHGKTIHVEVD